MTLKRKHFVVLSILFLLGAFVIAACSQEEADEQPHIETVNATPVTAVETDRTISVSGSIHPETNVTVGFLVAGKIQDVAVRVGDPVERGQVMARLDPTDYKSGLQIAEAKYTEIQSEYNRLTRLHNKGSITPSDYSKIVAARTQAEANYRIYKKKVADTVLVSPVSGIVSRKRVEPGEIVDQGNPCFTVVNISTVEARMAVPESEINLVALGQKARVTVSALEAGTFDGTVARISPVADSLTRTFSATIVLSNPGLIIRPGMIALSEIDIEKKVHVLTIPGAAIIRDPDHLFHVFVVDPQTKTVSRKRVTLSSVAGAEVMVETGLSQGDLVVTAGQDKLSDGMAVMINREGLGQ
ncbi:hemolysin secretion protein D [Desulfoluna limicola]|uniref:Hemolysin secretion protein D n=1 Tax=Desulfoluna limicola TaxID=2810562 RepID=A0ABN6F8B5_9BACT|nr:efflux RND transporter periplasmic adaptor subunit [Desulfoluna limicola]BCS98644.1 hemolysin secretion protein D [Desulfoluna limicola]